MGLLLTFGNGKLLLKEKLSAFNFAGILTHFCRKCPFSGYATGSGQYPFGNGKRRTFSRFFGKLSCQISRKRKSPYGRENIHN